MAPMTRSASAMLKREQNSGQPAKEGQAADLPIRSRLRKTRCSPSTTVGRVAMSDGDGLESQAGNALAIPNLQGPDTASDDTCLALIKELELAIYGEENPFSEHPMVRILPYLSWVYALITKTQRDVQWMISNSETGPKTKHAMLFDGVYSSRATGFYMEIVPNSPEHARVLGVRKRSDPIQRISATEFIQRYERLSLLLQKKKGLKKREKKKKAKDFAILTEFNSSTDLWIMTQLTRRFKELGICTVKDLLCATWTSRNKLSV